MIQSLWDWQAADDETAAGFQHRRAPAAPANPTPMDFPPAQGDPTGPLIGIGLSERHKLPFYGLSQCLSEFWLTPFLVPWGINPISKQPPAA
jgi:hypothetical protein